VETQQKTGNVVLTVNGAKLDQSQTIGRLLDELRAASE
jgi:hypothetical protein